jgi:hypothetical protein
VPFDQIEFNMKLERRLCHGAPFYVLGPLVTDIFPGYDHITSCIGATAAAYHGASMLCYVTPKEHLGLPKKDDVKQGVIAYRIAAHAADVALGIPGSRDRDDELTKARAALNWEKHFELAYDPDTARAYHDEDIDVDTDFCAMCGHDWCAVRISKEISEFVSGLRVGAAGGERGAHTRTAGDPRAAGRVERAGDPPLGQQDPPCDADRAEAAGHLPQRGRFNGARPGAAAPRAGSGCGRASPRRLKRMRPGTHDGPGAIRPGSAPPWLTRTIQLFGTRCTGLRLFCRPAAISRVRSSKP